MQRAAANPPLFYVLHAPIVGPLLESGHWKKAYAIGRAVNIFLGVLVVLSLAWAGWIFGGKRKALMAVALPAIGAMSFQFINLNQNYALDALLLAIGTLTVITWYKLLKHGLEKRYLVPLFLLSILGMSTKATYVVFLGISILAVFITAFIYGGRDWIRSFIKGSIISVLIFVSVLISIGWFYYYWNYKTSGKWYTGELPGDLGSRPIKSFSTVITHPDLWANFYKRITASATLSTVITAVALIGVAYAAIKTKLRPLRKDRAIFISTILLTLLLIGTTMTQITHAVGKGNFSFRYFLPAIVVYSLFIAYGLLEPKRLRGLLVSVTITAMAITSVIAIAKLDNTVAMVPEVETTNSIYQKLNIAMSSNGFPEIVLITLLFLLTVGTIVTSFSLFLLSKPNSISQKGT
jgi:4-amino-4-deoxy-L-arabinose transferase-like glycosyltransferase